MKKIMLVTIFLMVGLSVLLSVTISALQSEDPGVMLRAAIEKEEVDGDLQAAIGLYKQIVAKYSHQEAIAAKAQLRIGICYEKLGKAEAVKAYEAVVNQFADQAETVAEARSRLAALRKEESKGLSLTRLFPPEVEMECPMLSPDGMKVTGIVFDIPEAEGQNLAVYDLASKNLELITHYNYGKESRWTWVPIWSPDNREVAYLDGAWGASAAELWTSDLTGKSRLLFKNPNGAVVPCDWFPDGSAILVVVKNENNSFSLGFVSVKEGSLQELYPMQRKFDTFNDPALAVIGASADVSPDGRFIVFSDGPSDGSRDIFIISRDGSFKTTLDDHPADDKEPHWSPDGRHIVFLSNRPENYALWGIAVRDGKPDGSPFMILEGMQDAQLASWTKKGLLTRTVSLIRDVYTLEIDPKSHQVLGKPQALDFTSLGLPYFSLWSPDGKYLSLLSFSKVGQSWERSIVLMPSKGGEPRKFDNIPLLNSGQGLFQWVSDGSAVVFVSVDDEKHLHLVRLEPETGEWKTQPIPAGEFSGFNSNIAWSRDGKTFFYGKGGKAGSAPAVIAHNLETGQKRSLLHAGPNQPLPPSYSLKISRDYRRLALGYRGQIILVDTDTGHAEWLDCCEKNKLGAPSWSPDGQFLLTCGNFGPDEHGNELFIVSLTDGQVKNLNISQYLLRGSHIYMPDWAPDGRKIVFNTWMNKIEANLISDVIPEK